MKRLFLIPLFVLCMADDCDPPKKEGVQGTPCYQNGSCDWGLTCLQWKDKRGATNSICANPLDVKIGYAELATCEAKCPEAPKCPEVKCPAPPVLHVAAFSCPQPPPPVHCPPPVKCPTPPSPRCPECVSCPEVKECAPGWKRP